MWYYVDNRKKIGPLADAAILKLYSDGKISDATLVWSPLQKAWKPLSDSDLIKNIRYNSSSEEMLKNISFFSSVFRAVLISFCIFCMAKIYFTLGNIEIYSGYVKDDLGMSAVEYFLTVKENKLINYLLNMMLNTMLLATMYAAYKWTYCAAENAKSASKIFPYSPFASAISYFLPFINFIFPVKVIQNIFKASRRALREGDNISDIILTSTWWFIWVLTISLYIVRLGSNSVLTIDKIEAVFCFSIYTDAMLIATAMLFIAIVSTVERMQKKIFSSSAFNVRAQKSKSRP